MNEIINLIAQHGLTAVLVAYFLFKDYKFNGQVIDLIRACKEMLSEMKGYIQK